MSSKIRTSLKEAVRQVIGPVSRTKIADVNPLSHGVTVAGRVFKKGCIRTFPSKREPNVTREVFSFFIRDEQDSIGVTVWDDVQNIYNIVELGGLISIEGPSVKPKDMHSTQKLTSEYTLAVDSTEKTTITHYDGDDLSSVDGPIDSAATPLAGVSAFLDAPADVLGVVEEVMDVEDFTSKKGFAMMRQTVVLYDQTARGLHITFFDEVYRLTSLVPGQTVLYLQNVRIGTNKDVLRATYGFDSAMFIDPDIPQTAELASVDVSALPVIDPRKRSKHEAAATDFFFIEDVLALRVTSEPRLGFVVASVSGMSLADGDAVFQQCDKCRKKVDGDSCGCGGMPQPCFRLSVKLTDPTGTLERVSLFGQVAEHFLGYQVEEFLQLGHVERERLQREKLWNRYKLAFKLFVADNQWVRFNVLAMGPVDADALTAVQRAGGDG